LEENRVGMQAADAEVLGFASLAARQDSRAVDALFLRELQVLVCRASICRCALKDAGRGLSPEVTCNTLGATGSSSAAIAHATVIHALQESTSSTRDCRRSTATSPEPQNSLQIWKLSQHPLHFGSEHL